MSLVPSSDDLFGYWNPNISLRVRAAVVFKGGGIRGLFFPGHIIGLKKKGVEKIVLYAGTSAGALVAVGMWAGLHPERLHDFMKRKSKFRLGFALFSWTDPFVWTASIAAMIALWLVRILAKPFVWIIQIFRPTFQFQPQLAPGCGGTKFERVINEIIIEGLRDRGLHEELIQDFFRTDFRHFRPSFGDIWELVEWVRLITAIQSADDPDFEKVRRAYPRIVERIKEIQFYKNEHDGRTRNNIFDLIYGKDTAKDPYFCPLFLAACCVDDLQPVIFNNIDTRYWRIPIAEMARASAGHPLVFRSKPLSIDGVQKRYTDGGLMANFPVFLVHREFRRLLSAEFEAEMPEEYRPMVHVPFATLGLSVIDTPPAPSYLGSIFGLLTGGARDILELELARIAPYFRLVQQMVSGEPHYLNFFRVSESVVERTYCRAVEYLDTLDLSTTTLLGDKEKEKIFANMRAMLEVIKRSFPLAPDGYIRNHFYLETASRFGSMNKKAAISIGRPILSFQDIQATVSEFSGVLGLVRRSGKSAIARLDMLQEERKNNPDIPLLALRWSDVSNIPGDINFCLIIPIFDFRSIRYDVGELQIQPAGEADDFVRLFDSGVSGAMLGALSIDGVLEGLTTVIERLAEEIVDSGILPTMERFAFEIGCILSKEIGRTLVGERS